MDIKGIVKGLHHVTATVNDAQEDYDFYTKALGLRLVKETVNFDNEKVYHFYYANKNRVAIYCFYYLPLQRTRSAEWFDRRRTGHPHSFFSTGNQPGFLERTIKKFQYLIQQKTFCSVARGY